MYLYCKTFTSYKEKQWFIGNSDICELKLPAINKKHSDTQLMNKVSRNVVSKAEQTHEIQKQSS